jgi:Protein of unknown function (DUF2735)
MNTSLNQGSARIYQFPAGGRSALGGSRQETTKSVADLASALVSEVDCSGSWYHQEAINAAMHESKPGQER